MNPSKDVKIIDEGRTIRMDQQGSILSHLSKEPGPTDSLFDILAAILHTFSMGPHIAVLGFAGGGIMGPLRAMHGEETIHAVDLDSSGHSLFIRHGRSWAEDLRYQEAEAGAWLKASKRRFDAIFEDLSIPAQSEVEKPTISLKEIPHLAAKRLKPKGIYLANLFPPLKDGWTRTLETVASSYQRAVLICPDDYYNRLVLAGNFTDSVRDIRSKLNYALDYIGSEQANAFSIRSFQERTKSR